MDTNEAETILAHKPSLGKEGVSLEAAEAEFNYRMVGRVVLGVKFDIQRHVVTILMSDAVYETDEEETAEGHAIAFALNPLGAPEL